MNKENNPILENMKNIGNFTKGAVEKFESKIVTQKDYLEKSKKAREDKPPKNNI